MQTFCSACCVTSSPAIVALNRGCRWSAIGARLDDQVVDADARFVGILRIVQLSSECQRIRHVDVRPAGNSAAPRACSAPSAARSPGASGSSASLRPPTSPGALVVSLPAPAVRAVPRPRAPRASAPTAHGPVARTPRRRAAGCARPGRCPAPGPGRRRDRRRSSVRAATHVSARSSSARRHPCAEGAQAAALPWSAAGDARPLAAPVSAAVRPSAARARSATLPSARS